MRSVSLYKYSHNNISCLIVQEVIGQIRTILTHTLIPWTYYSCVCHIP